MQPLRKISGEKEARECLAAMGRTGADLGEWARARGIDGRSLNAWRVALARRGRPRRGRGMPRLVELVPYPLHEPHLTVSCGRS
jgi:hypothetical protein